MNTVAPSKANFSMDPSEYNEDRGFETLLDDLRFSLNPARHDVLDQALRQIQKIVEVQVGSNLERRQLTAAFANQTGCLLSTAGAVLSVLTYLSTFVTDLTPAKSVDEAFDSIIGSYAKPSKLLEEEEKKKLREVLDIIFSSSEKLRAALDAAIVVSGVTPMFFDLNATVELRSTAWPLINVEKALPSPRLQPIASVCLLLDGGDPDKIYFQVTRGQVDVLIKELGRLGDAMDKLKPSEGDPKC